MLKTVSKISAAGLLVIGSLSGPLPGIGSNGIALAEVSEWQDLGGGRARLVSVLDPVSGKIEGIIDVELKPGWTTYWRQPGEGGIPPDFDFSASRGVIVDAPLFPVPKISEKFDVMSIVYTDKVAFPFTATPIIAPLSGELRMELLMGVCAEICIPAVASFTQDLSKLNRSDPLSSALIMQAKERLPVVNSSAADRPQILDAIRKSQMSVLVRTQVPASRNKPELFIEGEDKWFFSPAKLIRREGETAEFEVNLIDLPEDADLSKTPLRFTLSVDGYGSEKTIFVDKPK